MVLGVTSRFREKFVTTVLYAPTPEWDRSKLTKMLKLQQPKEENGEERAAEAMDADENE